jgi:hypothetical protein
MRKNGDRSISVGQHGKSKLRYLLDVSGGETLSGGEYACLDDCRVAR